jgi:hypothetical protein
MGDHFQGPGKPPYSEQRGETGNSGVVGTIKAIIAGEPLPPPGLAAAIAAARALTTPPEATADGQDMGDVWRR